MKKMRSSFDFAKEKGASCSKPSETRRAKSKISRRLRNLGFAAAAVLISGLAIVHFNRDEKPPKKVAKTVTCPCARKSTRFQVYVNEWFREGDYVLRNDIAGITSVSSLRITNISPREVKFATAKGPFTIPIGPVQDLDKCFLLARNGSQLSMTKNVLITIYRIVEQGQPLNYNTACYLD